MTQHLPKEETGKEDKRLEDESPPLDNLLNMDEMKNFAAKSLLVNRGLIDIVPGMAY